MERPNYKITDYALANFMLKYSLKNLEGMKVYGSGWPIFSMDYPHLKVMAGGYLIFYDTSNVGILE
jgi:hypothetical protein